MVQPCSVCILCWSAALQGEAELSVAELSVAEWDWKAEGRGELIPRNFPRATTSHNNKIECESVTVSVCMYVCADGVAKPLGRFAKFFFQVVGLVLKRVT